MLLAGMDVVSQIPDPVRQRGCLAEERVIPAGETLIQATLNVPAAAHAVVAMLRASSAERFGVESRFVSEVLGQAGFATLQVDLLTPEEESAEISNDRDPPPLLSLLLSRVLAVVDWLGSQHETVGFAVGLLASRMETIPALMAAERDRRVAAVVSRGGCPDRGPETVEELCAPTLLLVGDYEQARTAELASEFFARRLPSQLHRGRANW